MKKLRTLEDLTPDAGNANKGTLRGAASLENSLRDYGAGRSILVDKNGTVIAGNKTLEQAVSLGMKGRVVETDGQELVIVQRKDLDLSDGTQARELAYADNRIAEVDLAWDIERMARDAEEGVELLQFWNESELEKLISEVSAGNIHDEEWQGMPEFEQEDKLGRRLIVHFEDEEAVQDFASLIGQTLTEKTKFIWYPKQERELCPTMLEASSES